MKLPFFLLLTFTACFSSAFGYSDTGECKSGKEDGETVLEIRDKGNEVRLGLTKTSVFMSFSSEVLSKINAHLELEFRKNISDFTDSRGEFIASPIEYLSESKINYNIRDIRTVENVNGELKFRYYNKKPVSFEDVYFENGPVLNQFSEKDAKNFVDQFYQLKFTNQK